MMYFVSKLMYFVLRMIDFASQTWGNDQMTGESLPFSPQISSYKALEPRHTVHITDRWAMNRTSNLQTAFFNGRRLPRVGERLVQLQPDHGALRRGAPPVRVFVSCCAVFVSCCTVSVLSIMICKYPRHLPRHRGGAGQRLRHVVKMFGFWIEMFGFCTENVRFCTENVGFCRNVRTWR